KLSMRSHGMGRLPMEARLGGIDLDGDDLVGIKDYEQGRVYYVPALFVLQLANETNAATRQKMIEVAMLAATVGGGTLAAGTGRVTAAFAEAAELGAQSGKALQIIDTLATGYDIASSAIKEHQGELIMAYGDDARTWISVM